MKAAGGYGTPPTFARGAVGYQGKFAMKGRSRAEREAVHMGLQDSLRAPPRTVTKSRLRGCAGWQRGWPYP
jgi:hypothetical protein